MTDLDLGLPEHSIMCSQSLLPNTGATVSQVMYYPTDFGCHMQVSRTVILLLRHPRSWPLLGRRSLLLLLLLLMVRGANTAIVARARLALNGPILAVAHPTRT